jgi:hypothetical protein
MVAVLAPGVASDFAAEITGDDFTFQGIFGFIRGLGENFQVGAGLSYIREFGPPLPLPFIYFDWNDGSNLSANGILPTNLDVSYRLAPQIGLGLSLKFSGNRYHGDPRRYGVDNPQLEYSEGTVSPTAQFHFAEWIHLNAEGGYAFYRNFRFLDGAEEAASYDMEGTMYARGGIVLGI